MLQTPQRVLVLAPHPDDGEFGCGGTIARFIEEGAQVFYWAFSLCEASMPPGFTTQKFEEEMFLATKELGIKKGNINLLDYPVRRFSEHRQSILENLVEARKQLNPDLVFAPSLTDTHQDHQVMATETRRAFKNVTVLGYELPWNAAAFLPIAISKLEDRHLAQKLKALACYKSQQFRHYFQNDVARSLATVRGAVVDHPMAEAFEVIRLVI